MNRDIHVYAKDDVIFSEGELQPWMYAIEQGSVGVYAHYGTPQSKRLVTLEAGEHFGEMGMLDAAPRSATVVAMKDGTRVAKITSADFGEYFYDHPEKILVIMQNMSSRIRELTGDYVDACHAVEEMTSSRGKEKSGWLTMQLQKLREALHAHMTANYECVGSNRRDF